MKKILKILIIGLILWGIIYELSFIFYFDKKYPEEIELTGVAKVVNLKTEKEKSNSYTIKIINSNWKNAKNTKIILYTDKTNNFDYGDIIKISGEFSKVSKAKNYKGFNYRNYLKQKKIYGSMYTKNVELITHEKSVTEKIFLLKEKMLNTINVIYEGDSASFLEGILVGETSNVSDEMEENFRNSSMSHVLAISGMHVSYVIIGMQAVLDKFINSKKRKNRILILLILRILRINRRCTVLH